MPSLAQKLMVSGTLAAALVLPPSGVLAQDSKLSLALNTVQTEAPNCRLTFVVENGMGEDIDSLVVEAVLFSKDGGILLMTLFDLEEIPARVPRVRQFVVPATTCENMQTVLINGVQERLPVEDNAKDCQGALTVSSRTSIEVLG